jgi:hypothetical protein
MTRYVCLAGAVLPFFLVALSASMADPPGNLLDPARKQAIDRLNACRKAAGVPAVTFSADKNAGCEAHARCLGRNYRPNQPLTIDPHDEDPKLPGFSEEGRRAARASAVYISCGPKESLPSPADAVEAWMATFYHRVALLNPATREVGLAALRPGDEVAVFVLDFGNRPPANREVILYPGNGQEGLPLEFAGQESPNPVPKDAGDRPPGFPVTITFPAGRIVRDVVATLEEDKGRAVPAWVSSPEEPAPPGERHQGDTVCLIPKAPLRPETTYKVSARAKVGGEGWSRSWRFTTGKIAKPWSPAVPCP